MKKFMALFIFLFLANTFFIEHLYADKTSERGKVVFVQGDKFYFDIGETTGIRPGMSLEIYRTGAEIKDPVTGEILGNAEEKLGSGEVTFVREKISCGKPVSIDTGISIEVGDIVIAHLFAPIKNERGEYYGPLLYKTAPKEPEVIAEHTIDKFNAVDFTIGDFDGDGRKEIAITDGEDIIFLTYYGGKFVPYYTFEGPWNAKFIDLSSGDFNENGQDELYVTNKPGNFTKLLVYEYNNDKKELKNIYKIKNTYAYSTTYNREKVLLGQKYGFNSPFIGSPFRMIWKGAGLNGRNIKLPNVDCVYNLVPIDFTGDLFDEFAALDKNDYLRIYNSAGKEIYKSPEKYGGSNIKLIARDRKTPGYKSDFLAKVDLDNDMTYELIAAKNIRAMGGSLIVMKSSMNPFKDSRIYALRYRSGLVEVIWETQNLGGYICHIDITDVNGDGKKDILVALVSQGDKDPKTVLKAFDLKAIKKTEQTQK